MRECPRCEKCYDDEVLVCTEEHDATNTKLTLPMSAPLLNGRYRLEKRLGRGAMGQVYVARDENLSTRRVAIKTVRPDILNDESMQEGEALARFKREAQTAASIRHQNVVAVTDFGKSPEGIFFLVMEYVEGETLYDLLRREGTLPPQRALGLLAQIAEGVAAAHEEEILHRDLKPANVFIMKRKAATTRHGDGFVKVGDFGLAKIINQAVADAEAASGGPQSRGIIGTPEYMAPEQMQSGVPPDARADVYALGVIAYHMLGGKPPFTGDLMQLLMSKMMQPAPPLRTLRADISPAIERAVMHALEREADKRPKSVAAWLEELEFAVNDDTNVDAGDGNAKVTVMAQAGAEVYVNDERKGIVGRSGRLILSDVPPGRHVLRVAAQDCQDDDRVIEVRSGGDQIIQANLRPTGYKKNDGSSIGVEPSMPSIIACAACHKRCASGAKFCGYCGNKTFYPVSNAPAQPPAPTPPQPQPQTPQPYTPQPQPYTPQPYTPQPQPFAPQPYAPPASVMGSTRCLQCQNVYPAGVRFCGRCGIPLPVAMTANISQPQPSQPLGFVRCNSCGSQYKAGTKFCGRCGKGIQ